MEFKDKSLWEKALANNQDPYGACVNRYAQRWAEMMEGAIKEGKAVGDVAKQLAHEADTESITGFMYGAAVATLSAVWEYGEQLRRWHNLDTQIQDEGEKANERGTVLNPAILRCEGR